MYPLLFDICPLTMRTQSILLVRDAISILSSVDRETDHLNDRHGKLTNPDPSPEAENVSYRQTSCLDLVYALDRFSNYLMENLERFVTVGDTGSVETIWACCIICLAHLAALSHLMSQIDSSSGVSMNNLCDLTLGKLGNLSLEVHIDEYSYPDILTGVRICLLFQRG